MLWVYGYYKYVYSFSAGIDFRRQLLTTEVDPPCKATAPPNAAPRCAALLGAEKNQSVYDSSRSYTASRAAPRFASLRRTAKLKLGKVYLSRHRVFNARRGAAFGGAAP